MSVITTARWLVVLSVGGISACSSNQGDDAGLLIDIGTDHSTSDLADQSPQDTQTDTNTLDGSDVFIPMDSPPEADAQDIVDVADVSDVLDTNDTVLDHDDISMDQPDTVFDAEDSGDIIMDAVEATVDVSNPNDVYASRDVVSLLTRCSPQFANTVVVHTDNNLVSRPVFMLPRAMGSLVSMALGPGGDFNVYHSSVDNAGTASSVTDVSTEVGSAVEGGSLAPDQDGSIVVWSAAGDGNRDVYLRRIGSNSTPLGTSVRVTNDPPSSESPLIVQMGSSWIIAWKSRDTTLNRSRLAVATVASGTYSVSNSVTVTPADVDVGGFDLVATSSRAVLVYAGTRGNQRDLYVTQVLPDGSPVGGAIAIGAGADVLGAPTATLSGTDLVVAWSDNDGFVPLRIRRYDLAFGTLSLINDLPELGQLTHDADLVLDGQGYALAVRSTLGGEQSIALVHLDASLIPYEGVANMGRSSGSGAIALVSFAVRSHAIAWVNVGGNVSEVNYQVTNCR